jgi:hypothetical protein
VYLQRVSRMKEYARQALTARFPVVAYLKHFLGLMFPLAPVAEVTKGYSGLRLVESCKPREQGTGRTTKQQEH